MNAKYIIAGEEFSSKDAVKQRAKDIKEAYTLSETMYDGQDFSFLQELFEGYRERCKKPYRKIVEVEIVSGWFGNGRAFRAHFADGGSDEVSYKNASDS